MPDFFLHIQTLKVNHLRQVYIDHCMMKYGLATFSVYQKNRAGSVKIRFLAHLFFKTIGERKS